MPSLPRFALLLLSSSIRSRGEHNALAQAAWAASDIRSLSRTFHQFIQLVVRDSLWALEHPSAPTELQPLVDELRAYKELADSLENAALHDEAQGVNMAFWDTALGGMDHVAAIQDTLIIWTDNACATSQAARKAAHKDNTHLISKLHSQSRTSSPPTLQQCRDLLLWQLRRQQDVHAFFARVIIHKVMPSYFSTPALVSARLRL